MNILVGAIVRWGVVRGQLSYGVIVGGGDHGGELSRGNCPGGWGSCLRVMLQGVIVTGGICRGSFPGAFVGGEGNCLTLTNINQSAPNLVQMYMTITSQMSSIMELIGPELSELSALELENLPYLTLFTLQHLQILIN